MEVLGLFMSLVPPWPMLRGGGGGTSWGEGG